MQLFSVRPFVPVMVTINTKCLQINMIVFQIGNVKGLTKILREGCGISAYLQIIPYITSSVG